MNNKNLMKKSLSDRIFLTIVYLILGAFVLVVVSTDLCGELFLFFTGGFGCGQGIFMAGKSWAAGI